MSQYRLHIKEPCGENWYAMHPHKKGRFCDACERTVVDFTTHSRADIWRALNSGEKVCGRFTPEQLKTSFKNPVSNSVATAGMFSLLASVFSSGEAQAATNTQWQQEQVADSLITFNGVIVDSATQEPIPYVKLYIDELPLHYGMVSSIYGEFSFKVPYSYLNAQKKVTIEAHNYAETIRTFNADSLNKQVRIELNLLDSVDMVRPVYPLIHTSRDSANVASLNDSNSTVIYGAIYETGGEEPMPFANVYVNQEIIWYKTLTDFDGKFELRVPNYMKDDTVRMAVRCIGYPPHGFYVVPSAQKEPLKVELVYDSNLMGDVVIIKDTPWLKFRRWWRKLWHKKSA